MTDLEKRLAAALLRVASERFARHTCNDFRLVDLIPDVEERRALVKAMHEANGDPEEYNPDGKYEYFYDWWLMSYLAGRVLE